MKVSKAAIALALGLGALVVPGRTLHADAASDLFNAQILQRIDIDMHSADWARLKSEFQTNDYYPADVSWNGNKVYNAAVRSRGVASRSGQKPGLKVDFNQYASGQTFLGLKSLVLDNFAQDPSGIHETVAMWFFTRLGIPAPREAHAVLYVNGDYAGLYAVVEPIDKAMIARALANGDTSQNDGYLYEFNKAAEWGLNYLGSDLTAYKPFFGPKTHETSSDETLYRPIETMVRVINESAPEDLAAKLGPYLDLNELVRYLALQNFICEIDGFVGEWGTNNFYLYRLQQRDLHEVIAWDEDLSFQVTDYGLTNYQDTNVLVAKLMMVPEYRSLYFATLREAAASAEEGSDETHAGALEVEIRRQLALTEDPLLTDPVRLSGDSESFYARDFMKRFAQPRIRFVQCEVERLTGGRPCN